MKAVSILGSSSNAGKSWMVTAFAALLRRRGIRVAPFKAQNMSNNSYVTLEGGEIGRAQAAQAEAAGLRPIADMNPILLKPSGDNRSQLVLFGKAVRHYNAQDYYQTVAPLWEQVCQALERWKSRCDVLLLEGAGSPVELNLMDRDLVNLRPIKYLDGRWILTCDIERGGVFAQAIGTHQLLPPAQQARGIGLIVNKFRGDSALFNDAAKYFGQHMDLPYLGVLPMAPELQPETEDGFAVETESSGHADDPTLAWIRFPRISNTQDIQPWGLEHGIRTRWVTRPTELSGASAIILPGSKNTVADLQWLHSSGLAQAIRSAAAKGVPVVGICGGYQMLGQSVSDPEGIAGDTGQLDGLRLLDLRTVYRSEKTVRQVEAQSGKDRWQAYEIHMGETLEQGSAEPLLTVQLNGEIRPEGMCQGNIWGSYLHGLFESPNMRAHLAQAAGIADFRPNPVLWTSHKEDIYSGMADLLEAHLDLDSVWRYVDA
ncbi:MAG: cobyric acid synthase [Opitutales bacterium]|nr:cobyric acid synthase [Opitutales bacterium]